MGTDAGQEQVQFAVESIVEQRCRQLEDHNEALRERDRGKDQFLAVLGHELRNLLAPVAYTVDLMRMSPGDESTVQECCAIADRQLKHMVRLIDDLLDVTKIARGNLTLRLEQLRLVDVMAGAVEICRSRFDERRQRLKVRVSDDSILVRADQVRLTQVFANLLLNASKFSPCESDVELTVDSDSGNAIVCIQDYGIGIAVEELGKVFEMYFQVHSPLDGSPEGLGIGLGLAKAIVELHSGSITVKSDGVGCGCRFIVRIPSSAAR